MSNDQQPRRPTPWQILKSILGGAMGVQSEETRRRDFTHGHPLVYVIGGVVFTVIFIGVLVVIANLAVK